MKLKENIAKVIGLMAVSLLIPACYNVKHGKPIEQGSVSQIQKGITTRAEVERMFGAPLSATMRPDGGRMLIYNYTQASGNFAPFVGAINQQTVRQMLQVLVDTNNVVQDYEFSGNTNQ